MAKEDMQALKKFGRRVRELRKRSGLSQEDLALESRLDRTFVSHVERGARNASILSVLKLARALGVKASRLLDRL